MFWLTYELCFCLFFVCPHKALFLSIHTCVRNLVSNSSQTTRWIHPKILQMIRKHVEMVVKEGSFQGIVSDGVTALQWFLYFCDKWTVLRRQASFHFNLFKMSVELCWIESYGSFCENYNINMFQVNNMSFPGKVMANFMITLKQCCY